MKHVLIIGGTGMLKQASVWLNAQGYHISVIARGKERLAELGTALSYQDHYTPIILDYREDDRLRATIQEIQAKHGPIHQVVSWISTAAPQALKIVLEEVSKANRDSFHLVHVLGSRSNLEEVKKHLAPPPNCHYCQVKLGFVIEGNSSRWLTHDEISAGVIQGIQTSRPITIVGTLGPWDMRP